MRAPARPATSSRPIARPQGADGSTTSGFRRPARISFCPQSCRSGASSPIRSRPCRSSPASPSPRRFKVWLSAVRPPTFGLKWPNDVLVGGRKIAGILCERHGDSVIVGIGVNVLETEFPSEIAGRATSLALVAPALVSRLPSSVSAVRDAVLAELGRLFGVWREKGFAALHAEVAARDVLKGRSLAVRQTDGDAEPVRGVCGGIQSDGSLLVGETRVYAGEAHVIP